MKFRRGKSPRFAPFLLASLAASACRGGQDPSAGAAALPPSVEAAAPSIADSIREALVATPPEATRNRVIRVLLVNESDLDLAIVARAGAAEVTVDSVAGRDSARVDLVLRGDSVELRALGARGTERARTAVRFTPDSILRWAIP